ncbi:hypothetical protein PT974_00765 [Cladobotryum mycophilum]|uniref:Uncharacterized protein n=1 Tax=Cladobotryum mycophilum TaxID=491253 RepID=A0ABR0T374_9HYPO
MSAPDDCPAGNSDLYGLGVRAGLYAQWTATLLTTVFEQRDVGTYRVANLIIQVSIFLGLCIESKPGQSVIGALVTQYLLMGSLSSVTGDGVSHLSHMSGIARILFYLALSSYGCWFWFTGIDEMTTPGCPDIAFFGETSLHGRFRTAGKVAACAGLVICFCALLASIHMTTKRFRNGFANAFVRPPKKRPQVEISLVFLSMALIGCSIYLIEHLISVNDIKEVDAKKITSVGQLIPLLAGGLACALTLWKVVGHGLFLRKRCWFLFGHHL